MQPSARPVDGLLVGWLVVLSVIISCKGGKLHFYARIGALVFTTEAIVLI